MKKHGNIQMEIGDVMCSCMYEYCRFKKKVNDKIVLDVFIICRKL